MGPGQGVLTRFLVDRIDQYKVVEIDQDMVDKINADIPQLRADQIIFKDIMKLDVRNVFNDQPFSLVGNFPYNISSQLLFIMYEYEDLIPTMIGMYQKEVADRVLASHGNKTYGILSVLLQSLYDCKKLFNVSPGSFNPPPKVDSTVIKLTRNPDKQLDCDKKLFKRVVKMAFNQRRKMLKNNLKLLIGDEEILKEEIFSMRAEQLSVADFINITKRIESLNLNQ